MSYLYHSECAIGRLRPFRANEQIPYNDESYSDRQAIIKDYIKANKIEQPERSASVISTEIFKQKEDELVALVPELKQDLVLIQKSINLELMDRRENTRKHVN